MAKNELTVWNWGANGRYYLTHPWKWFKELLYNIQNAHSRMTKGYCSSDWMNFDNWFKQVASDMFRDMAMHSHGYPGSEPFDTPEKWSSWLHRISDQLRDCIDEDQGNEYYQPFIDLLMKNPQTILTREETEEERILRKKYYDRSVEVQKEHKELFEKTMKEIVEHFDCLWD